DGGALPTATYQKFLTSTVPMKYNYGRVSFTGPTIAATRDTRGAYARVVDTEIRGVVDDLQKEVNRQLWGIGYGILARWETGSSTSYTIQKSYTNNAVGPDAFGSTFGAKYLAENNSAVAVVLASMSSATSATYTVDATDLAISAITNGTGSTLTDTITVSNPTVTEAVGMFLVRPASLGAAAASGAHRLEMMGLRGIVDSDISLDNAAINDNTDTGVGTTTPGIDWLQGVSASTYTWFQAIVMNHSSGRYGGQRAITDKLLQTMFDAVEKKAGKDYGPDLIMTTRPIRNEILQLWKKDRRFVNTKEFDGGWTGLEYNGIGIFVDNDAIDGEIYFLTTKDLQIYRMSDYDW
ncbi:hypothetical protein LCGC14_3071350, partial [marine sediment metagenome]